ncbi:EthD family reductase [Kineobactrum sediminis]|uniref:EthD family reductase n=1 Tax=Kineobactrum sediminis TaxID=1905677 RepID=A0A2N5Y1V8_9GAMM|nr:EthD family reductase [Kineobactrum sediminis]PLW82371.1 EthD family reductase [Kineobactrum sediminis]
MYCMTVEYPKTDNSTFDYDYFRDHHVPLCVHLFADHGYVGAVMRSHGGKKPGAGDLNWVAIDLLFESKDKLQEALAGGGAEVSADVPNYTNVKPHMSFSEVTLYLV